MLGHPGVPQHRSGRAWVTLAARRVICLGEAPQAPAQHRCRERCTQAGGRVMGTHTSQRCRWGSTCVCIQRSQGQSGSMLPELFAPEYPLGCQLLGVSVSLQSRWVRAWSPHVLALHQSSRCRCGLLLSVWKENGCCSCKIIPNPSRLSSTRQRRAGTRVRLPARLVAAG